MAELTEQEKANGYKLFKARIGNEARLTNDAGHIQIIGDTYVAVHPMFHADAYASGCASSDMFEPGGGFIPAAGSGDGPVSLSPEQRKEKILEAIIKMGDANDVTQFTGNGVPKTDVISQLVGFNVSAAERDAIWKELLAEKD